MRNFEDIQPKKQIISISSDAHVSNILGSLKELYKENDFLRRKLEPYEKGTRDNEIIQELKEEVRELRAKEYFQSDFNFTEEEYKKGVEWCNSHYKEKHRIGYGGAGGGSFTWKIVPTGLGLIKEVCCTCGDSFNLTPESFG